MTDVLFDYKYVVQGDIIAFLISIVTHFLLKSTYMAKKANLGIFKIANVLVGVASVSSVMYHYFAKNLKRRASDFFGAVFEKK